MKLKTKLLTFLGVYALIEIYKRRTFNAGVKSEKSEGFKKLVERVEEKRKSCNSKPDADELRSKYRHD